MSKPEDGDLVVGSFTLNKVLLADGQTTVLTDTEGLNIFEVIGMLTAELDMQRRVLADSYVADDDGE